MLFRSAKGVRVLVVDDQPDNRRLLLNILEPLGYVVVEAVDGLDALEKFAATAPKFILMDLQMPRMDGCQAIREIRQLKGGEVFIIAISAGVVSEKFQMARQAGADACLGKPFKDAELLKLMVRVSEKVQPNAVSDGVVRNGGTMEQDLRDRMLLLSPKWIQGLVSAAQNAEYRKLTALVDEIREVDPELASGLNSRVEAFDYESVLHLLNSMVT